MNPESKKVFAGDLKNQLSEYNEIGERLFNYGQRRLKCGTNTS